MISKKYSSMLNNTSIIREFAQYASKRAAEIGAENVFNYTIGNPSVPTTDDFNKGLIDLIQMKAYVYYDAVSYTHLTLPTM